MKAIVLRQFGGPEVLRIEDLPKVIAAAGADERVALALEYGADFGVNYRKQDLAEEVMKLTDNDGVDVVCENIADPTLLARRVQ